MQMKNFSVLSFDTYAAFKLQSYVITRDATDLTLWKYFVVRVQENSLQRFGRNGFYG